jgi:hypothetical protein
LAKVSVYVYEGGKVGTWASEFIPKWFLEKRLQEDSKFMLMGRIWRRRVIKSGQIDLSIPPLKCV